MSAYRTGHLEQIDSKRLVGFIGGYLVAQGSITLEQLDHALLFQMELAERGEKLTLAQVLQRLGYVTPQELARAIKRQQRDLADQAR